MVSIVRASALPSSASQHWARELVALNVAVLYARVLWLALQRTLRSTFGEESSGFQSDYKGGSDGDVGYLQIGDVSRIGMRW